MDLLIVGTGYVGLVTGACFAEMGHQVVCLDIDRDKVAWLQRGRVPFFEPGLEELVHRGLADRRLSFTCDYEEAVARAQVCFVCVPTPAGEDGAADLSMVLEACRSIARHMTGDRVVVMKSTVPVGTAGQVRTAMEEVLAKRRVKCRVQLVSNPEFLKEGDAVNDCMKPDRIIIGADEADAVAVMRGLYQPFMLNSDRMVVMDPASAELTKYASNAMLAARISFMNELAGLCEAVGANVTQVRKGMGSDPRIGKEFLYAGAGYGGSCFPKDVQALIAMGREQEMELLVVQAVHRANERQKQRLGQKILAYLDDPKAKTVGIWGLSFKPNTDDMREAPSLVLIQQLVDAGVQVRLFDPVAMANAKRILGTPAQITWCRDPIDAATGADAVALVTEWKRFRLIDLGTVAKAMRGRAFFDGRNQYDPAQMTAHGLDYFGIGIPITETVLTK